MTPTTSAQSLTGDTSNDGTEPGGLPSASMLNTRPPRTYIEWTVRGFAGSSICFVTFNETDARRHYAKWLDHGESVELVKREVTTWTETRYTPYEVVVVMATPTKCRCGHRRVWHDEPMANGQPCCSECGCDDFEPILKPPLTKAQQDALNRAEAHPRKHVLADPRVVRALLDKGLIHVGYYGECADGADFGPILGAADDDD